MARAWRLGGRPQRQLTVSICCWVNVSDGTQQRVVNDERKGAPVAAQPVERTLSLRRDASTYVCPRGLENPAGPRRSHAVATVRGSKLEQRLIRVR